MSVPGRWSVGGETVLIGPGCVDSGLVLSWWMLLPPGGSFGLWEGSGCPGGLRIIFGAAMSWVD
jgi:hypothetical protein